MHVEMMTDAECVCVRAQCWRQQPGNMDGGRDDALTTRSCMVMKKSEERGTWCTDFFIGA